MRFLIIFAAAVLFAEPAHMQYTIVGTWTVQMADASGTVVLESEGGRLSGTWIDPEGGRWRFEGRLDASRFEFATESRPVEAAGNGTAAGRYRWTFKGDNDHDTLRGTVSYHREGDDPDRTHAFTATRKK